ncbi:hypothetical protein CR513_62093, partial [Mucuna pruriens]
MDSYVYVDQPLGFENFEFPNHEFKLKKVIYGLKQALRAWYDILSKSKVDVTPFVKTKSMKC